MMILNVDAATDDDFVVDNNDGTCLDVRLVEQNEFYDFYFVKNSKNERNG